MLRKIFISFIFFFPILLKAQNELGFLYLPNLSSMHNKGNRQGDPIYQPELTISQGWGASFAHHANRTKTHGPIRNGTLGSHFRLKKLYRIDLIYMQCHQKWRSEYPINSDSIAIHQGKKRLGYLKLPLMYQLTHPINNHFAISFYGGPQISLLLRQEGGIVYWERRENDIYYDLPFADKKYFKPVTIDAVFGINLVYRFTAPNLRWYELTGGVRGDWTMSTVERKDAVINNYPTYGKITGWDKERTNGHNTSLAIACGLNYIFHEAEHHKTRY
jgi:hypothetical protein